MNARECEFLIPATKEWPEHRCMNAALHLVRCDAADRELRVCGVHARTLRVDSPASPLASTGGRMSRPLAEGFPKLKEPKKRAPVKKRQNLTRDCDTVFGRIVRSTGVCQACGAGRDLQCAHGFSRRYRATRWDFANAFCLCRGCHLKYTVRPLEWEDWMRARMGDAFYSELRVRALTGKPPKLPELLETLRAVEEQRVIGNAARVMGGEQ